MPLHTRRWNDEAPAGPTEALRVLITRYRPRGVAKADETWDVWMPQLGPSKELLAAFNTKTATPLPWETYLRRYRAEMAALPAARDGIAELAERVKAGEAVALLCSSACDRESRCHRSVLRELIEAVG